jgi:hypothetical protein
MVIFSCLVAREWSLASTIVRHGSGTRPWVKAIAKLERRGRAVTPVVFSLGGLCIFSSDVDGHTMVWNSASYFLTSKEISSIQRRREPLFRYDDAIG